jgi:2-(3-amino-3-carboxypropyl)histidine synthase
MFELETKEVIEYIRKGKYHRVLLQFPEGLKPQGFKLARDIEKESGVEAILSADPCFGACDVAVETRDLLEADLIVHYGHSPMVGRAFEKILHVEARATEHVDESVKKALELLDQEKNIGLATTVQHLDELERAAKIAQDYGKEPYIGKAAGQVTYAGQVLGCDYSTVKSIDDNVDAYIFIGGGDFHAIGIQLATGKRTIVADPYLKQARDITSAAKIMLKKRWAAITKFQDAKRVGIVIGIKTGQRNIISAENLRNLLESTGKESVLLSARECIPENLESFVDIEAFVITACPRLAIDDQERFRKPILNTEETLIAIGRRRWEDYGRLGPEQEAT